MERCRARELMGYARRKNLLAPRSFSGFIRIA
jgi:hypothetical protein